MTPDPTSMIVGAAGLLAIDSGREFLKRIAGKLGDDAGGLLSEVTTYRLRNLADRLRRAHELADATGQSAQAIPPRLLVPLLDGSSLEDDAELQARWESLIANAAIATDRDSVSPYFAEILSHLTPFAARVLSALNRPPHPQAASDFWRTGHPVASVTSTELAKIMNMPNDSRLEEALDILVAVGVVTRGGRDPEAGLSLQEVIRGPGPKVVLNALGRRFLEACSPPGPPADDGGDQS